MSGASTARPKNRLANQQSNAKTVNDTNGRTSRVTSATIRLIDPDKSASIQTEERRVREGNGKESTGAKLGTRVTAEAIGKGVAVVNAENTQENSAAALASMINRNSGITWMMNRRGKISNSKSS